MMQLKTRLWANKEREAIQKWADQQRALIKKEQKRVMNDAMASHHKKRQEGLEERAAAATMNSQKQLRAEIETLKTTLQKQKIDFDTAKSRTRVNEKRLRDLLSERDETIASMRKEIDQLKEQYSDTKKQRDDLLQFKREQESKKKKRKKRQDSIQIPSSEKPQNESTRFDDEAVVVEDVDIQNTPTEMESDEVSDSADNSQNDIEDTNINEENERNYDDEAIRVMMTRKDIVETPTEDWLQKHLHGCTDKHVQKNISDDSLLTLMTPMKGKVYDPNRYTPLNKIVEASSSLQSNSCDNHLGSTDHGYRENRRIVTYRNGTQKEILSDGTLIVRFMNGDVKTTYSHIGIVVYYYAETRVRTTSFSLFKYDTFYFTLYFSDQHDFLSMFVKTSHTSHPDGLEVFEFATGQTERHYPNGRKEVYFPDGTEQTFLPNGDTVNSFPDGVNVMESKNDGTKIIQQTFI